MPGSKLAASAALAAVAGALWVGLVTNGAEATAPGTVLSKGYVSGGTYVQQPVEARRGFRSPTAVPVAESNTFELRLDGVADVVRASFNTVKSRQFEVGQRVVVRYVRRGFPLLGRRIVVTEMTPADPR